MVGDEGAGSDEVAVERAKPPAHLVGLPAKGDRVALRSDAAAVGVVEGADLAGRNARFPSGRFVTVRLEKAIEHPVHGAGVLLSFDSSEVVPA